MSVIPDLHIISRWELFRAILSVYDCGLFLYCPAADRASSPKISQRLLFGYVFETMLRASNNALNHIRFAGIQLMETWLSVLEEHEARIPFDDGCEYCDCLAPRIAAISHLLMILWGHPAKLISHIVPVVYQRLVDFLAKSRLLRLVEGGRYLTKSLEAMITEALSQPAHHRGRYQSLNALLPKVSPELFIASQPSIVADLIKAISAREVSSAASKLLGTLLRYLRDREGYQGNRLRQLWMTHAVCALCSTERRIRQTTADYLITELLSFDPTCGHALIYTIRNESSAAFERRLFAIVHVVLQCRLHNLGAQEIVPQESATNSALSLSELRTACACYDVDIRLTSLLLIVASHKPAVPLVPAELEVFKETFLLSLKDSDADHRHRILRVVQTLILRVNECLRVAEREGKKLAARMKNLRIEGSLGVEEELNGQLEGISAAEVDGWRATERLCSELYRWFSIIFTKNMFPGILVFVFDNHILICLGATFDRELASLDVLNCIIDTSGLFSPLLRDLLTPSLTASVVNMFISSWDKVRHLSADILLKFPRPLPGFAAPSSLVGLLGAASYLTGSARQRESDAGAQIIRVLFEIYCVDLGWELNFESLLTPSRLECQSPSSLFFSNLLDSLSERLEKASLLFSLERVDSVPEGLRLCHGLILGTRYCLSSAVKCAKSADDGQRELWLRLFRRTLRLSFQAMEIGVSVVAEAPSDVDFSPHLASLGPVNANSYLFLNTNSFVGATSLDESTADDSVSKELQRAIVGAWLLVKEASCMLSRLVDASIRLLPEMNVSFLTADDVDAVGLCFVDSLCRLKHMGAISEVHSSLQKASEVLLRHGFHDANLCNLPLKWLHLLLDKLESEQQVFILRRSSGFAYSFLSLLRAEVSDSKPYLLPIAMDRLLRSSAEPSEDPANENGWRKRVHALNITRLILLDASVSPNLDPYVAEIAEIAVLGFKSRLWAIRNSCMMVFSALVQRAVTNEKNDFANKHSSTPTDFFHTFPSLFPFLLRELSLAAKCDAESSEADLASNLDILFPLLLLLAKLRPEIMSTYDISATNSLELSSFISPIEICCGMENMLLRKVAAKAFRSVTPLQACPDVLTMKIHELCDGSPITRMNKYHGQQLLVLELLESLYINSPQLESFPAIQAEVLKAFEISVIPSLEKLVTHSCSYPVISRCPTVLFTAVNIVDMACLYFPCTLIKRLQWTLSSYCYDLCFIRDPQLLRAPHFPLLIRSCMKTLLILMYDRDGVMEAASYDSKRSLCIDDVLAQLGHTLVEIRHGILEGLEIVASHPSGKLNNERIMSALLFCLANETHPILRETCLGTLSKLTETRNLSVMGDIFIKAFTDQLPNLSRCIFKREFPISFDADGLNGDRIEIRAAINNENCASYAFELLAWFCCSKASAKGIKDIVHLISICCADEYQIRGAVAGTWFSVFSLIDRELISNPESVLELRVKMCLAALTLLQDDDEDIRAIIIDKLRLAALWHDDRVPYAEGLVMSKLSDYLSINMAAGLLDMPDCGANILREIVDYYFSQMKASDEALESFENRLKFSRIFEEEVDNQFRESLVVFDVLRPVFASALSTLVGGGSEKGMALAVSIFRELLSKGIEAMDLYVRMSGGVWIGDCSFNSNMFEQLNGIIPLLRAISPVMALHLDSVQRSSLAKYEEALVIATTNGLFHPLLHLLSNDD